MSRPSIIQLKEIAQMGGNIIVNANDYSVLQIKELIFVGKRKGISVTIRNAGSLSCAECKQLAFLNPAYVTFDFS